jgi:hypothetical protein
MIAVVQDPEQATAVKDAIEALGKRAFVATVGGPA